MNLYQIRDEGNEVIYVIAEDVETALEKRAMALGLRYKDVKGYEFYEPDLITLLAGADQICIEACFLDHEFEEK